MRAAEGGTRAAAADPRATWAGLWGRVPASVRTTLAVLAVFVASRIVTTAILLWFAAHQAQNAWTGPQPGYAAFAGIWDGNWYWIVAVTGYPSELPLTADGHVGENAWAFLPLYPLLARGVMLLTALPFQAAGVVVSVLSAAGAALVVHRVFARLLPPGTALFAVALFCVAPLSPILQVDYAEPLFLLLLAVAILLLAQHRYLALIPVVVLMDLTRPGGIAFALTLAIHVVVRFARRADAAFGPRERVAAVVATAASAVAGLAWPVVAWLATGDAGAYTETELAWRMPYIGYSDLLPFTPWVQGAQWWFARAGWNGTLGVAVLVLVVIAIGVALFTPPLRRLGTDLRAWLASYLLYTLAVFFPQSSTFRILIPLFPALGALALPRSRLYRVLLVLACIAGQVYWVHIAWAVDGYDWTPP
ncbi:hypothetical protein QT381_14540 [Galbitalea sp. SE-J8]|uniref:hypothetical protein n=1 Tax=Galbitalea sp. SE-J8 TaxID=3054952 RepID=UPI00259C8FF1|nr:hypothetical protein [Galbitalea sp. SE-J8]MDM4764224.1 hypothetical protein [Galbitalea sp. SE-J8]